MNEKEVIKHFKTLLQCEQFVVTGSYALQKMGLVSEKTGTVGDLDIILVNPTEEAVNILSRLAEESPAETQFNYPKKGIILKFNGTKIDFFFETQVIATDLMVDGVFISPANRIVEAKKSYNRDKDWHQLRKMSRIFFKQEEFETYLNSK
jgi:hypothetical protein